MPPRKPPTTNNKETGAGTVKDPKDPKIIWVCPLLDDDDRTLGCEQVVRECCEVTGSQYVWIRHVDHKTIRTYSRDGRPHFGPTDPHITVFMSRTSSQVDYQGHLFVTYNSRMYPKQIPESMATSGDLKYHEGRNPELWQCYPYKGPIKFDKMYAR
ncbi:hypothetical protein F4678DRAFT_459514 [Xylaria arbuscula]|nr:hypothetical protein F4678DRAFT_459514 [Xylaria arbuscula]